MSQIQGQMTNKEQWETVGQGQSEAVESEGSPGGVERTWLQARPVSVSLVQVRPYLLMTWGYVPNLCVFPHHLLQTEPPDSIKLPGWS